MPESPDMLSMMQSSLGVPAPPQPEPEPEPQPEPQPQPQPQDKTLTPDQYQAYKAAGWTDEQLKAEGFTVQPFEPKTEGGPKLPPKKRSSRGRPQKTAALKILEACAAGGCSAELAEWYLSKLDEIK